jgi:hypothetical protein
MNIRPLTSKYPPHPFTLVKVRMTWLAGAVLVAVVISAVSPGVANAWPGPFVAPGPVFCPPPGLGASIIAAPGYVSYGGNCELLWRPINTPA